MDSIGLVGGNPVTETYGYLNPQSVDPNADENIFLDLLVSQLENQNPLEPLENNEFIQQMSSLASLEETQALNDNIQNLIALQEIVAGQNAFTQSAALVGKNVEYIDPQTGEPGSGIVDSVHLNQGGLFLNIDGVDVPMNSVTGIIAVPEPSDETDVEVDADDETTDTDSTDDTTDEIDADGDGLPDN